MKAGKEVKRFLAEAGRKGGSARSEAKVTASRSNGRKGGRPPTKKAGGQ